MIRARIRDMDFGFETDSGLFSPRKIDAGTLAMLSCVQFRDDDKVLDLGCGYGPVGIFVSKLVEPTGVYLLDSDPIAVEVAARNVRINGVEGATVVLSDGFRSFDEAGFTQILCNPPYHSDFAVPKHFIHKGFNRLVIGGTMWMVTQRQTWYRNKLRAIFGSVQEHSIGPYVVFEAVKRSSNYASAA
jgi:16S rRNA (guanine1207-N2)-methyltransferase